MFYIKKLFLQELLKQYIYPLSILLFFLYNNHIQKINCQKKNWNIFLNFKNNRIILYIFNNIIIYFKIILYNYKILYFLYSSIYLI